MCAFEFMPPMLKEEAFMVQYCFETIHIEQLILLIYECVDS